MTHPSPNLSLVVTARNDRHGGDFLRRMQFFVSGFLEQARRFKADSELIIVEWNPPEDRPRLKEALNWPSGQRCSVRIIEVPSSLHTRYRYAKKLPLYQMIAKNVGIRRAQGSFVLATNVDVLFSDELAEFLSRGNLRTDLAYRIDRYDVPSDIPDGLSLMERLDYCKGHILRVNTRNGTFTPLKARTQPNSTKPHFLIPSAIYFFLKSRRFHRVNAWGEKTGPYGRLTPAARVRKSIRSLFQPPYSRLHTNACGDFTLLARDVWFALRGYPEFDMYSFNLDSLLLHMACDYGLREWILQDPMRIYHLEHSLPWVDEEEVRERVNRLGVPMLRWDLCEQWLVQMHRQKRPIIFNDENWGLASHSLPETRIEQNSRSRHPTRRTKE